jgi:predicted ester cyclase
VRRRRHGRADGDLHEEPPVSEANKALVRDLIEALWAGDLSAADAHPGFWPVAHTFGVVRAGFPDLSATVTSQIDEGDTVVTVFELTGTHTGPFLGAEPSGELVTWTLIYVDKVRDGKVVDHASGDGWMDALMRIGALPPPG